MKDGLRHNRALFVRLLAALILLAVLPCAVIGYVVFNINRSEHIRQVSVLMNSLAADRELTTRLLIEKQRDALGFIARDPNTVDMARALSGGRGPAGDSSFLEAIVNRSPFFGGLSIVDSSSGAHRSAGAFPKSLFEKSMPDMKRLREKPLARTEILPGGKGVLLFSQPIHVSGKKAGADAVLLGVANLAMLDELYKDTSMLGTTGESFLSDSHGVALTALRYSSHAKLGHPIDASAMQDCLLGNSKGFVITDDYIGAPTAMSYRPVKGYGGCIMVHMRAPEVMAPVNAIRNMIAAIVLTIAMAVTVISVMVVKKLVRMDEVRTHLEEDLANHASLLEANVAERTSALNSEIKSRIEAEHLLSENKAFLEDIVRNVHEAIWAVNVAPDGELRFMWSNAKGEELLGAGHKGAPGQTPQEVFGPDLGDRLARHYGECVEKGVLHYEETFNTDKGPRVFLLTLVPVRSAEGQVRQIISSAMDITERKQLEGEMVKAQKLESLGVLAGGIAHDFNNLLASIRLNVSMLKLDSAQSPDSLEMLNIVETSALMAANLTNQLLTFAKGGKPVKEAVPVAAFLNGVASFSLRGTKSTCSVALADGLLDMEADPGQITQVINNLLINAEQAMPDGGVVKLSAENVEAPGPEGLSLKPGKYVKITVEDTGAGIPEEHLSRIFDPYFTTKKNGSGLGLASSYSIIKNHGGHISVNSIVGRGTRFEVFIPGLAKDASKEASEPPAPAICSGRVLVMDDDDLVRSSVCRVLEALGYDAAGATDGLAAALEYKKGMDEGKPFDAVILDLTVRAGMGGEEAAARILELDRSAKMFVSSGYPDAPVIVHYRDYGFTGFLQKPYDASELDRKLRGAITEKKE